ncbi:MAG: glycosyltransferase family 4 protein [Sulfurimonas sp.]|jgi:glycosyltransferase involved in cell wall biosynthesis
MKKKSILHISPHLGGGVGTVLLNYLSKVKHYSCFEHRILCLDSINDNAKSALEKEAIVYKQNVNNDTLLANEIAMADIVVIHWWNHPLLYELLVKKEFPASRVIIWSHISGFSAPSIFVSPLFDYADKFVFTTPLSYESEVVKGLSDNNLSKLSSIWSTGGLERFRDVEPLPHKGFIVGYIGTVDYAKMHRSFLDMSASIDIEDIHFVVCGGECEKEIVVEAIEKKWADRFNFTGKVPNVGEYLSTFDVFGYPLNPQHYGTCDQTLAEAMACGVVPVVFDNGMESYMVKDGTTGLVVKNGVEYKDAIEKLHKDPQLRIRLSRNAQKEAFQRFSLESMSSQWESLFNQCMELPKSVKKWSGKSSGLNVTPIEIFYESLGDLGEVIEQCIASQDKDALDTLTTILRSSDGWNTPTKGSPQHYLTFFEEDATLQQLVPLCQ